MSDQPQEKMTSVKQVGASSSAGMRGADLKDVLGWMWMLKAPRNLKRTWLQERTRIGWDDDMSRDIGEVIVMTAERLG